MRWINKNRITVLEKEGYPRIDRVHKKSPLKNMRRKITLSWVPAHFSCVASRFGRVFIVTLVFTRINLIRTSRLKFAEF